MHFEIRADRENDPIARYCAVELNTIDMAVRYSQACQKGEKLATCNRSTRHVLGLMSIFIFDQ